jgi:predicted kinase
MALALRDRLGLPLIAKDTIKESLGERFEVTERRTSRALGVATFHLIGVILRELLAAGVSTIAEGNFVAGTAALADLPPARIVQVFVTAQPDVLRERLLARDADRHRVHYDREAADEVAERAAEREWRPLPLDGELVHVDTTVFPMLDTVVEEIARLVAAGRP